MCAEVMPQAWREPVLTAGTSALLEDAYSEMLQRLAIATEYRDDMTGGHHRSVYIAERLLQNLTGNEPPS